MDQIHHIRALYYEQGKNISEIATITGLNWKTVAKYVDMTDFNPPAPKPAGRLCPKLDPYKPLIDQWLEDDKKAPRKQHHTAKRVYTRLQQEVEGFDCSYRVVARYVSHKKQELNLDNQDKGKAPLIHHPGEAQCDFGSAQFFENSMEHDGKYLVLSFPYSNQGFHQLFYGENMECLLEGLDAVFRHIGGVPTEIWFDNTATIVTNIIRGGGRDITERFARFQDHYRFKAVFMNPESGWEKGNVEAKVKYSRSAFLVPVPHFMSLSEYNAQTFTENDHDGNREHYRYDDGTTISDLFEDDRKAFLPLPEHEFDLSGWTTARTNGWGKFTLDKGKHEYSVSPQYTNTVVNVRLTSSTVTVLDEDFHEIVTHKRLYGDYKQESMEWIPYLDYVSRHPRSLMNSGIFDMMPDGMQHYLQRCENSERGKILKVIKELTDRSGFDSAVNTVNQALQYQATDPDSLRNLYRSLYSDIPQLPPMQMPDGIPKIEQMPVNLQDYDRFLGKGGAASNDR